MKRKHYSGNWSKVTLEISTRPSHITRNGLKQEKFNCYQCNFIFARIKLVLYDELSDQGYTSLPKSGAIESGQMVSEKVKLTYFDVYLSQTM
jgi:hypothetical protein